MSIHRDALRTAIMAHMQNVTDGTTALVARSSVPEQFSGHEGATAFVKLREPRSWAPMTMGPTGKQEVHTVCDIHIVLGHKDLKQTVAEAAAVQYADQVRYEFGSDFTLGGLCDACFLTEGNNNLGVEGNYADLEQFPQLTYQLDITNYVQYNQAASSTVVGSLVTRAFKEAVDDGWRQLGTLTTTGQWFRETDIFYNSDDGYYYAFNTEMTGGVAPTGGPYTISTWTRVTTTATLNLSSAHNIPVGTFGTFTIAGTGSTQLNGVKSAFATSTTQVTYTVTNAGGTSGTGGTMTRTASEVGMVGMRRSTTLEALTAASGADYVPRVTSAIWYPTVVLVLGATPAQNVWHLFGPGSSGNIQRKSYTGAYPSASNAFGTASNVLTLNNAGQPMGDPSIRLNPNDNYYYCVGTDGTATPTTTLIYKIAAASIATDGWANVTTNVWADIGLPPYFATGVVDPNLAFIGDRVYLTFDGTPTGAAGTFGIAVVELDPVTYKAIGLVAQLQTPATYESWQGSTVLGDPQYIDCADGVPRIVGFTNNLTYDGTGNGTWGCLDLPTI